MSPGSGDEPPILVHLKELGEGKLIPDFIENYRATVRRDVQVLLQDFHLVDVALKVVGVGSVGTLCFVALFIDEAGAPLFLQVKEAEHSVLEAHWKPGRDTQQGQRVVDGQLIMQAASDIFLGWATGDRGRHFYVRQFKDMKGSVDVPILTPAQMVEYLELCGWTLARAHAQSGTVQEIAGYLGSGEQFDEAVTAFAAAYADQNEIDYRSLLEAIDAGRLQARTGI